MQPLMAVILFSVPEECAQDRLTSVPPLWVPVTGRVSVPVIVGGSLKEEAMQVNAAGTHLLLR